MENRVHHFQLLAIFCVGMALSVLGFYGRVEFHEREFRLNFEMAANSRISAIRRKIENDIAPIYSIRDFFESSESISRASFHTFVSPILKRVPGIRALEWIPSVSHERRSIFRQRAVEDGHSDFQISERTTSGKMKAAGDRDVYYPVYYVEPLEGNEAALGFDLGSNAVRLAALQKARETRQLVVSSAVTLIQTGKTGVLTFAPIFRSGSSVQDSNNDTAAFSGFALGVIQIDSVINAAFETNVSLRNSAGVDIYVYDQLDSGSYDLIYLHHSRSRGGASAPKLTRAQVIDKSHFADTLKIGDRKWHIVGIPVSTSPGWQDDVALGILIGGIVVTLMLTLLVRSYMNRHREVEELVRTRTAELEASRSQSAIVLAAVPEAIVTIDAFGIVQSVNDAVKDIFGYEPSEIVGQNVNMLMPHEISVQHDRDIERYKQTGVATVVGNKTDRDAKRKDGTPFPIELSVEKFMLDDKLMFLGSIRDISERRQIERLKDEFMSSVSHELRTPLTVVLGYLPFLTDPNNMPDPEFVAKICGKMQKSGDHLLSMINDLLVVTKLESGNLELNRENQKAAEIVQQAFEQLALKAEEKGLELTSEIDDCMIMADSIRLLQVMINLVSNAIKFTDIGGIHVSASAGPEFVTFEVVDTGCGIPADQLDVVFDRFRQIDGSSTRGAEGTGLGLAIAKSIIELHGGEISLVSEVSKGSKFSFTIPAGKPDNGEIE
jgi:PAS domain S-box-containing protein